MSLTHTIKACLAGQVALDSTVTVRGWVKTKRDSKAGLSFINLHDGSCFAPIQLVANNTLENYQSEIQKITTGCSIVATGKLVQSQGKGQAFEIQADTVEVIGWIENPETYPIQAKRHTLEYLREVAHLRPRTNTIGAVMRIRNAVSQAIHQFLHKKGYLWIHTPIITSNDCEGAGELFRVSTLDMVNAPKAPDGHPDFSHDFFGRETFLTVSGQLNVEAFCLALSKVYTFGPTFRAENSNTSRHLAEFWMVEPELAFGTLNDICKLSEEFLHHVCATVLEQHPDDLAFFNQHIDDTCLARIEALAEADFERISYKEAIKLLEKASKPFEYPVQYGLDLQSEHERYLTETHFKQPVIVTDYPKGIKSFYMRLNDDNETVAAMDVLVPGIGEIIGGSQREERLDVLSDRMEACGLDKAHYQWYLDLRKYGTVPHAGFGLGLERLVSYITGVHNIRDVIPFPRTPGHAEY